MSEFHEVLLANQQAETHFTNALFIRNYKSVTTEHGPSQALIDFVNHDKQFGSEIGLESFESFSTLVQHEIMLNKFNSINVESFAMEGLLNFLKKYRGWLLLGGFIIPPLWTAGIVGYVAKALEVQVPSYADYVDVKKEYGDAVLLIKTLMAETPSGTDPKSWAEFKVKSDAINEKIEYTKDTDMFRLSHVEVSGWTADKFTEAAKFLEDQNKAFEEARDSYAKKLGVLESFVASNEGKEEFAEISRIINSGLGDSSKSFHKVGKIMASMRAILSQTSKGFEFKK